MKLLTQFTLALLTVAFFLALAPSNAAAQGRHPEYIHALTDLRTARAHLEAHNGGELGHEEREAIHEINDAIDDIKKAAVEDGKDLNEHPHEDAGLDRTGRLHRAMQLLDQARSDIAQTETNSWARGLQERSFGHIERARHHVGEAIRTAHGNE